MRVWQICNGFSLENLRLVKTPSTILKNNQVRVKIHACSLNYRDLMVVRGQYNPKQLLPLTPLSDCAGEVVSIGDLVSGFKVGDKVCATFSQNWCHGGPTKAAINATLGSPDNGVLAEECDFYERGLVHFPPYLSYEEASTLPCAGVTAYNALVCQGRFLVGNTVLLQGTGGVSIFALQFAKAMGLRIIITSSSDQKLQRAKELGADDVINYSQYKEWHANVLKLTNSEGVDGVIDVGGAKTIGHSILSCKPSGVVCVIGVLSGSEEAIDLRPVLMRNLRLQGIFVGAKTVFLAMNELLTQHKIHPVIDEVFNFEEAKKAFSYFELAKHFGKVVIRV